MAVDLQLAGSFNHEVPDLSDINKWVSTTLSAINHVQSNVTICVVEEPEIADLNHRYRGKNRPTNVLAFPFESVVEVEYNSIGDIVICFPVVKNESNQQDIDVISHFAHMVIHGTLHLCGYDHQSDEEAEAMEVVEKGVMAAVFKLIAN